MAQPVQGAPAVVVARPVYVAAPASAGAQCGTVQVVAPRQVAVGGSPQPVLLGPAHTGQPLRMQQQQQPVGQPQLLLPATQQPLQQQQQRQQPPPASLVRPPISSGTPQQRAVQPAAPAPTTAVLRISGAEEAAKAAATITAAESDVAFVEDRVRQPNVLVLFSKTYCPFVNRAKDVLKALVPCPAMDVIELDLMGQPRHGPIQQALRLKTGSSTVPQAFVNGSYIGGCQEIENLQRQGQLLSTLQRLGCTFGACQT
mmetsp:Transcript_97965/g.299426  ORF Transcript_97965/g.299426 Transcript_97965/m.299426 type:complete len:257 (-) Transcript_97965:149-919(-)